MTAEFISNSTKDTLNFGRWLGSQLPSSAIVGLNGPLGTGKTWMVKGIVAGLGDFDTTLVKSPAYNLVHEYPLRSPTQTVFHVDFYRLNGMLPQDALYFADILETPGAIKLVEWASPYIETLVSDLLMISLALGQNHDDRLISFHTRSSEYSNIVQAFQDTHWC